MKLSQVSFSSGEVSPSLGMRVDLARYQTALKTCRNFFVRPTGGVSNRAGTRFIEATKVGDEESIIVPFIPEAGQGYLLEFGEEYIRVFLNGSPVMDGPDPLELETPYQEEDLATLRFTQSADVLTIMHVDYPQMEFRRLTASTFEVVELEFDDGPFLDINDDETIFVHASKVMGRATLTATSSIFSEDQEGGLFRLEERDLFEVPPWEPSKVLVAGGGGGTPFGLLRRSDGKVYRCVTDQDPGSEGIFTGTVRPNHDKGVASDGDGNGIDDVASYAGVEWEYVHSGFGIVRIVNVASGTSATADVLVRLPDTVVGGATTAQGPWTMTGDGSDATLTITGATSEDENDYEVTYDGEIQPTNSYTVDASTDVLTFYEAPSTGVSVSARQLSQNRRTNVWAFGAWSEDQGYPSCGTYYQDRLVFAASSGQPQTEWASKTGDYHNFGVSSPLVADDAITQTLNARQINTIRELVPLDQLIAITSTSAWASPRRGEAWTPETIGFDPQAYKGSAPIKSVLVDDSALYVQDQATKIRDLRYSLESDKFSGGELTVLSRHLFGPTKTIVDMDYATEPDGILWCVRSDGVLCGLTYLREQEVIGWHRHDTPGGYFERVCVVPENSQDVVYFIVRRTIGGETVRYIERLVSRDFEDIEDAYFVDCGLSYDGEANDTFSGLDHLEGESVVALADGNVITDLEVEDGEVTLPDEYSVVHIGIAYTADLETMDLNVLGRETIRDIAKNIPMVALALEDTRGIQVGPDESNLEEIINRDTENYDEATRMVNGVGKAYIQNSWNGNGRVFVRQPYPLPATVLAIIPQVEMGGSG
jgi:hypothetical protein